ncbi:hypothetical protein ACFL5Q_04630 [Planctomycetota bacterium]
MSSQNPSCAASWQPVACRVTTKRFSGGFQVSLEMSDEPGLDIATCSLLFHDSSQMTDFLESLGASAAQALQEFQAAEDCDLAGTPADTAGVSHSIPTDDETDTQLAADNHDFVVGCWDRSFFAIEVGHDDRGHFAIVHIEDKSGRWLRRSLSFDTQSELLKFLADVEQVAAIEHHMLKVNDQLAQ